jgi:Protein of unknown function (DUF3592)
MGTINPQSINVAALNSKGLKIVSLVVKLFAAFPLLIGLAFLAGAAYSAYGRYNILKHWPSVDAQVTQSRLASHQEIVNGKNGSSTTTVYTPQIEFRYALDGKEYTTPANASYSSNNYADMKQKVDIYAAGTRHAIRYNPANPNDIRYDVAASFDYYMMPVIFGGVGLVAFLIGLGLFLLGRAMGSAKVRCPSCGEKVTGTESTCPLCGAPLIVAPGQDMGMPGS